GRHRVRFQREGQQPQPDRHGHVTGDPDLARRDAAARPAAVSRQHIALHLRERLGPRAGDGRGHAQDHQGTALRQGPRAIRTASQQPLAVRLQRRRLAGDGHRHR
nr:hypothetical protein [Tanacetum cinerariifolium]